MSRRFTIAISQAYLTAFVSLNVVACAVGQSVEALSLSHLERTRSYHGLCFEYSSVQKDGDDPEIILENELSIFSPLDARSRQSRRMWICRRKNPGELWDPDDALLVHKFCGFDGREGRLFIRNYSDKQPLTTLIHTAVVSVQDPLGYQDNRIEEFLTGGPHLIPEYQDPRGQFLAEQLKMHLKLSIAGEVTWKGRPALKLIREGEFEAIIDQGTGNCPLKISSYVDGKLMFTLETKEVGSFEGVNYIKSGEIRSEAIGQLKPEFYSYTVNNVRRIAPSDVFWPEWPLGTGASNDSGERVVNLPYPPERREGVRIRLENQGSDGSLWMFVTVLILFTILAVFLYRRKYAN